MNIPNFDHVKRFFESWGMYPGKEDTTPYNEEVIRQGINNPCFKKMREQAEDDYGSGFRRFVTEAVDATDDAFYVRHDTWKELEDFWFELDAPGN